MQQSSITSLASKELASTPSAAYTAAYIREAENAHETTPQAGQAAPLDAADPLATLAKAVSSLSPADKAKLLAMMTTGTGGSGPTG